MKVCAKCGNPYKGFDVCENCGSTDFRIINKNQNVMSEREVIKNVCYPNGSQYDSMYNDDTKDSVNVGGELQRKSKKLSNKTILIIIAVIIAVILLVVSAVVWYAQTSETNDEVDDNATETVNEEAITEEQDVETTTEYVAKSSVVSDIEYGEMYEATFISVTSANTLKVDFNGEIQEIIMLLVEYDEDELTTTEDDAIEYLNSILSSGQTIYLSFPRYEENQQTDDGQYRCYVWLSDNIDNFYQPSQDFFLSYSPAAMLIVKGLMIPSKENSDYNKYYIMLGVFQENKEYFVEFIPK